MDDIPTISEHDVTTGEIIVRPMNAQELQQRKQDIASADFPDPPVG